MTADESDPRLVVVADSEGILVTRDGGCTWERAVEYTDFLAPLYGSAVDATVAGTGPDRSLHVLVAPWHAFVPNGPATLFSSFDDGATWNVVAPPPATGPHAFAPQSIAASPAAPGRVYLLANHWAASAVYASNGREEWRRRSLSLWSPTDEACVAGACASRPFGSLYADPSGADLWAGWLGAADSDEPLARSSDEGESWEPLHAPAIAGGVKSMDVGPRSIALVGDFSEYALSRDDGRSWAVGKYPTLTSSDWSSRGVVEVAHFDHGRALAILPGYAPASEWAGNILVFDGRRWTNAAPPEFSGYDRSDEDGHPLFFESLTSTDGPLLALNSRGELAAFRT